MSDIAPTETATTAPAYELADRYCREEGPVFLTGIQALVRLPMLQRQRDLAAGHDTAGYVTGYRGSPPGGPAPPARPGPRLDGRAGELRLRVDHREARVAERTRCVNRLRWPLHELDPSWDPPARSLCRYKSLDASAARLRGVDGPVARIAGEIVAHARDLTVRERALEREIRVLVAERAPTLMALAGVGALTANG